jgi:hypothetical protein
MNFLRSRLQIVARPETSVWQIKRSARAEAEIASAAQVVAKTMVSVFKVRVLSEKGSLFSG